MSRQNLELTDALRLFVENNPDLPDGQDSVDTAADSVTGHTQWPRLDISYERKGRGGKPATIIHGFGPEISDSEIAELARTLRQRLATGGSSRGGEILLQGDKRNQTLETLKSMSIKARII